MQQQIWYDLTIGDLCELTEPAHDMLALADEAAGPAADEGDEAQPAAAR